MKLLLPNDTAKKKNKKNRPMISVVLRSSIYSFGLRKYNTI